MVYFDLLVCHSDMFGRARLAEHSLQMKEVSAVYVAKLTHGRVAGLPLTLVYENRSYP